MTDNELFILLTVVAAIAGATAGYFIPWWLDNRRPR